MKLRLPLLVTAVLESVTGVALLLLPRLPVALLFGRPPATTTGLILSRCIGVALLALGVACWWAAHQHERRGSATMVKAAMLYDVIAAAILIYAGLSGFAGTMLWPAVIIHVAMTVWCVLGLLTRKHQSFDALPDRGAINPSQH